MREKKGKKKGEERGYGGGKRMGDGREGNGPERDRGREGDGMRYVHSSSQTISTITTLSISLSDSH